MKEPSNTPKHDGTIGSHEVRHTHGRDRDRELRDLVTLVPIDPPMEPEIVAPKGHKTDEE